MELGKCPDCVVPPELSAAAKLFLGDRRVHFRPFFWGDFWQRCVFEDPAVKEFHDIEWCPYYGRIFTQGICLWNRHVGRL